MATAKSLFVLPLLLLLMALPYHDAEAQFADATSEQATAAGDTSSGGTLLTAEELNTLVAPVALYPDELLAIVLPASTNPIQVVEAQRFLENRAKDPNLQPDEGWDPSVLALINYPDVVKKMSDDIAWCQDLGNAVLDQQDDVLNAIQTARGSASDAGYLQSNDQVTVVNEGDNITVELSDPEVIYVPQYDPAPVVNNNYTNYPPPYHSTRTRRTGLQLPPSLPACSWVPLFPTASIGTTATLTSTTNQHRQQPRRRQHRPGRPDQHRQDQGAGPLQRRAQGRQH